MITRDPQRPSAFANAILDELRADPGTPMSAHTVGELVGLTGWEAGQRLRELHAAGLVEAHWPSAGGGKRTWQPTDAGRAHVVDLSGIDHEITMLEDNRDARRWAGTRQPPTSETEAFSVSNAWRLTRTAEEPDRVRTAEIEREMLALVKERREGEACPNCGGPNGYPSDHAVGCPLGASERRHAREAESPTRVAGEQQNPYDADGEIPYDDESRWETIRVVGFTRDSETGTGPTGTVPLCEVPDGTTFVDAEGMVLWKVAIGPAQRAVVISDGFVFDHHDAAVLVTPGASAGK